MREEKGPEGRGRGGRAYNGMHENRTGTAQKKGAVENSGSRHTAHKHKRPQ